MNLSDADAPGVPLPWGLQFSQWLDGRSGLRWFQRLVERWIRRTQKRPAAPWEWDWKYISDGAGVECHFAGARVPIAVTLICHSAEPGDVSMSVLREGQWIGVAVTASSQRREESVVYLIKFSRLVLTEGLRIHAGGLRPEVHFELGIEIEDFPYQDGKALRAARDKVAEHRDVKGAVQEYLRCLRLAPRHGQATLELAQLYQEIGDFGRAERWLFAAISLPHEDTWAPGKILDGVQRHHHDARLSEARALGSAAAGWPKGEHHGAVCLLQEQRYWLGFDRWHAVNYYQLVEIRRRAAARLLGNLRVEINARRDVLLMAMLRILRIDGSIHELPEDQYALLDSPDQGPEVRVEEKKTLVFLLPKIDPGDILEVSYCLLHCNDLLPDGRPDFYINTDLLTVYPTWVSTAQVLHPREWPVKCVTLNGPADPEVTVNEDGWRLVTAHCERQMPEQWGVTAYEQHCHHPYLCCSWGDRTWEEYGREQLCSFGGATERPEPLPDVIGEAIAGDGSVLERLERGFNWVRENLRYMSLPAAKRAISRPDRARQILARGGGDCDDRAYLVHLICQSLGLESEFVLSGESGYVVAEVPGHQFDHVFVRTRVNDGWLYLDATDSTTPFGRVPWGQQGLSAFVLGKESGPIELPEHPVGENMVVFREVLTLTPAGELAGDFELSARGVPARIWDDWWKSETLRSPGSDQGVESFLRGNLPGSRLLEWETVDVSRLSDVFVIAGRHIRSRLSQVDDGRVGVLDWNTPLFPHESLSARQWEDPALLPIPFTLAFSVDVCAGDGWHIAGSSPVAAFDAEFGSITAEQRTEADRLLVTRKLIVKQRVVRGPETQRIGDFVKAYGDALRLTLMFRRTG